MIPPLRRARQSLPRANSRGSLLIVAMLLSAVIAISLGSYIALSRSSLKLANRSFYSNASMNTAASGIEEALWSFNQATGGAALATAWASPWNTSDGVTAHRTFTDFTLGSGVTAAVRVYVDNYNPTGSVQPKVVAQSTITMPTESLTLSKTIEVTLRRRSKFAMGLVAKNQITFRGNVASVDSWNSLYDDSGALRATPVAYGAGVAHDHGSVGSTSVAVGSVAINNADIWGFASVGGNSSSGISVGSNGTVAAFGSPAGTVDTSRVATDFTANFDSTTMPAGGTVLASVGSSLGTVGATNTYTFAGQISSSLTIHGNVTLLLTAAAGSLAVKMSGGDLLTLDPGATLTIYTAADLQFTGNGISNPNNQASTLQIWGTSTSTTPQSIDIGGGATVNALIYAPDGNVTIRGTPDVTGSVVADNIDVTGSAKFHYDESLANWGGNNPFGVVKWRELVSAGDRAAYSSVLNSW